MIFLEDRADDGQTKRSEKSITFVGVSKALVLYYRYIILDYSCTISKNKTGFLFLCSKTS